MSKPKIEAQRITKPIQLLAAWLIGLILVDGSFLGAAVGLGDSLERLLLVVAAIFNVPAFLVALFLLQTKFRPELQEDAFYFEYISKKTNTAIGVNRIDLIEARLVEIQNTASQTAAIAAHSVDEAANEALDWSSWKIALNTTLPFYREIIKKLHENNIDIANYFGEPSDKTIDPVVVSISEEMDVNHTLALLKIISDYPVDKYDFWIPLRDAGEDEDVYIGAYGPSGSSIPLTESRRAAIRKAQNASDLRKLKSI